MPSIELTIVAARRPSLLGSTLESFNQRLFRHFKFERALINIDPLWGSEVEMKECVQLVRRFFPDAVVFNPESPSYCLAVKRLWTQSKADFLFHLEDDWLLTEDIESSVLRHFDDPSIAQVSLLAKEKNWDRDRKGDFHYAKRRPKVFGVIGLPFRIKSSVFTVSPSFVRGDFARKWASMMDEKLDPEKQTYTGVNPRLEKFGRQYRNYLYPGKESEIVIEDTGRDWRAKRNIEKKVVQGQSMWTSAGG